MDFFKSVSARVGDVAKNVGDLLLDSDSESDADERSERTRRGGTPSDADGAEGSGSGGRRSNAGGDGVAEGANSDSEGSEEDDGPLISEDVWNTLRAAKDRVARAAKTTVASVSRDVSAAAETVRRDLGELSNEREPSNEVVFVGDAASEYAAGGSGGLGVSVESDDDDDDGGGSRNSDGDGSLDPDVAETFERTAEALENVGEKVERFGAAVFQNAGRLFDKIVDTFEEEDEDREGGRAKPPGSYGVESRRNAVVDRDDSSSSRRRLPQPERKEVKVDTPEQAFQKKVAAMQRDSSTYCDEPSDASAFARFAETFDASSDETKQKIDALLSMNSFMKVMSGRIVPAVVEHDVFWSRYFFQLHVLERERDGGEEPERDAETEEKPAAAAETAAETPADASGGEGDEPEALDVSTSPESADLVASEGAASSEEPEEKVEEEGEDGEPGELLRVGKEEEGSGTLPRRKTKTETSTETNEAVGHERVVVAGDDFSEKGHRRVVSLATDDGTVASDDSLGKDWTRVRDVESPSYGLSEAVDAAAADDDDDVAGSSGEPDAAASNDPAESVVAASKPPPKAPRKSAEEDSDLDEDWGMDSD